MKGRFKRRKLAVAALLAVAAWGYLNNTSLLADPLAGGPFLVAHRGLGQGINHR